LTKQIATTILPIGQLVLLPLFQVDEVVKKMKMIAQIVERMYMNNKMPANPTAAATAILDDLAIPVLRS
jgi:hypothetical protein